MCRCTEQQFSSFDSSFVYIIKRPASHFLKEHSRICIRMHITSFGQSFHGKWLRKMLMNERDSLMKPGGRDWRSIIIHRTWYHKPRQQNHNDPVALNIMVRGY